MKSSLDVALYLYGEDLDPLIVSQVLGVLPTKAWRKGGLVVGKNTRAEVTAKTGLWMRKTASQSNALSDHVREILAYLSLSRPGHIRGIKGLEDAKVDVYLLPETGKDVTLSLDASELQALGQLGLRLDVTSGCLKGPD